MNINKEVLVSIGVPCYNRADGLNRLLLSLVSQGYGNIEIIISDNASGNSDVRKVGEKFARQDKRIRYFRQERNIGITDNFKFVRDKSLGQYFMWAADDDYFDDNYIEECVFFLNNNPEFVLAAGKAIYRKPDQSFCDGVNVSFENDHPVERIKDYFYCAMDNGFFYGVFRTSIIEEITFDRSFLGEDWVILSEIAYIGKIKILSDTYITRDASHLFHDDPWKRFRIMYGLPKLAERVPMVWLALEIQFFIGKSEILPDSISGKSVKKMVFTILMHRFKRNYPRIKDKVFIFISRLYYPAFCFLHRRAR
ncbi:MAG: glycosyltransferase family 2 protein [Candidatus Electrothrix sp. AR1]|nr:glycosyltransferase family 2 protein [Candidatus Electrothrix sp. AR1]